MTEQTKTCPFCAETIKAAAVVCRFCNHDLGGAKIAPTVVQNNLRNCPDCGGRGEVQRDCYGCQGVGKVMCDRCGGDREILVGGISGDFVRCNVCHGNGQVRCDYCSGSGNETEGCSTCHGCGQVTIAEFGILKREREAQAHQREIEQQHRQVEQAKLQAESEKRKAEEHARWLADEPKREAEREAERTRLRIAEQQRVQKLQHERMDRGVCILCGTRMGWLEKLSGKIQHEHCSVLKTPTPIKKGDRVAWRSRCNNKVRVDKPLKNYYNQLRRCCDCGHEWDCGHEGDRKDEYEK